jgi:translation initiation factor 3 subunit I
MRPILLKGHEKALTLLKYNREGDLIFTTSRGLTPCVWYADNGERLGTYNGHTGAVWTLDVNYDTTMLLTGSGDNSARLWDVESGKETQAWFHRTPVRSVGFSEGDKMILTVTDQVLGMAPTILFWDLSQKPFAGPIREITGPMIKINQAHWGTLNNNVVSCSEDGTINLWEFKTGHKLKSNHDHTKSVNKLQFDKEKLTFISASSDTTARLFDADTLECKKIYDSERPVNASAMSPLMEHIILGGGQEASQVTTTHSKTGNFQVRFFHKIFQNELGNVKGHFGPVHTLMFSPDGRSYASGSEDGYVRIQHFDPNYFDIFADDLVKKD